MEDFIAEVKRHNQSGLLPGSKKKYDDSDIIANSIYVVDDEKQRGKMMQEFYVSYKKDIDFY